jgi:hypothetical protein
MDKKGLVVRHADKKNKRSIKLSVDYILPHHLRKCDRKCVGCGALHWTEEATQAEASKAKIMFSSCCQKNKVALLLLHKSAPDFPLELKGLFDGTDKGKLIALPLKPNADATLIQIPDSENFKLLIRLYNNAVSFTLLKTNIDHSVQGQMRITVFRMSGVLVHQISSIETLGIHKFLLMEIGEQKRQNCKLQKLKVKVKAPARLVE